MRFSTRLLALPIILGTMCSVAQADPPPMDYEGPPVFCFRITDIEYTNGVSGNSFLIEFEVLNWTDTPAAGLNMALNVGTSAGVTIGGASIDPDGRGGPTGGSDIGAGVFDPTSHQSGRGRGDLSGLLNDWGVTEQTSTALTYDALTGTEIPNRDLLNPFGGEGTFADLIPGLGTDGLGDSAIDGGPLDYEIPLAGPPSPDGSGNVLDGFVLQVDGLDAGDTVSVNWFLLGFEEPSVAAAAAAIDPFLTPIGTSTSGNQFGFGTFSLARVDGATSLPGPLFVGNTGFNQNPFSFFDTVYQFNPEFAAEFGAGITARFADPNDDIFNAGVNTSLVPEPGTSVAFISLALVGCGLGLLRRRRRG